MLRNVAFLTVALLQNLHLLFWLSYMETCTHTLIAAKKEAFHVCYNKQVCVSREL